MASATYLPLLRTPGVAAFFLPSSIGRVGIAMTSLGVVWLVHAESGSFAVAGLVTGGFAVAEGLVGPQVSRLMDHHGQTSVLPPVLAAHAATGIALILVVTAHAPTGALVAGGALLGATIPQLGALSAARWAALLRQDRSAELPAAFSLESMSNGAAYLVGPVLVSALAAAGYPRIGSLLAAALIVGGGMVFATQRDTAPSVMPAARRPTAATQPTVAPQSPAAPQADPATPGRPLLLRPPFVALLVVNLALGIYFGSMQISVTALTVGLGAAASAAPLFAVSSVFGLLGGWLYGKRRWTPAAGTQLAVVSTGLAIACAVLLLRADSLPRLGTGLAVTGLTVPPILVLCSLLAEAAVDHRMLTQAFTWLSSASAAGSAVAASVTGLAVDSDGPHAGLAIVTAAASAMAVTAALAARTARGHSPVVEHRAPSRRVAR